MHELSTPTPDNRQLSSMVPSYFQHALICKEQNGTGSTLCRPANEQLSRILSLASKTSRAKTRQHETGITHSEGQSPEVRHSVNRLHGVSPMFALDAVDDKADPAWNASLGIASVESPLRF